MNVWTEHRNPEGRTYWFNTTTRESVWEKPDELKTPFEKALSKTSWKEYFSGGRKYYYNPETKVSKWEMPDELKTLMEEVENEQKAQAVVPAVPGAILAPQGAPLTSNAIQPNNTTDNSLALTVPSALPVAASAALPSRPNLPDDPIVPHNGFSNLEDGEKAFHHLLRKAGVDPSWTWEQTMRATVTDPLYKALPSLADRKAAWQKYVDNMRAKEQEEREARLAKLRPTLRNMLKGNPNVFHYTTFATADKIFAQHPTWQQGKIEAERRMIFEEYVAELKQREVEATRAARTRATAKVVNLFKQLDVDVLTKWRTAYNMLLESEQYQQDPELQKLPTLDILLAFEDYSRVREREYEEQMRRAQVEKTRRERKAREAFKALLQGLVDQGKIGARTKWKEIYPLFSADNRYLDVLGNPGSNPLELFWDVVDGFDQKLDAKIAVVQDALSRRQSAKGGSSSDEPALFTEQNTPALEDFIKMVREDEDEAVKALSDQEIEHVYKDLQAVATKKAADEKRRAERKKRHLQEDLRYALKKLPEPIDLSTSFENAAPLMEHLPEYQALDDEGRRAAFDKFIKRQKERMREAASEDGASTTSRRRKEPTRDERDKSSKYDRDRERERDSDDHRRDHHRSSRHRGYDDYKRSKDYEDRDREPDDWDRDHGRLRGYDRYRKGARVDYSQVQYDEPKEREKRPSDTDYSVERSEKKARYEDTPPTSAPPRDETPEEGEI